MNILVDQLPEAIEIDGKEYPINSDFRSCLRIIMAFEDPELTMREKNDVLFGNLYPQEIPENVELALAMGNKFLNGGKDYGEEEEEKEVLRVFSFSKDAELIFSAFKQTHGIDLETAQLHWWKFLALFEDLGSNTVFAYLVGLRKRVKTGKATKEERAIAVDMGDSFDIPEPDTRTREEKDHEETFLRAVEESNKRRLNGIGL